MFLLRKPKYRINQRQNATTFSLQVEISYQIAAECNNHRPFSHLQRDVWPTSLRLSHIDYVKRCTVFLIAVSNTVRMHHLQSLFSFYSQQFQIVLSTVTMHALETLFPSFSLQFQIVSNYIRVHALETLFSFLLCSSKSFEILSECMKVQRPICNKYILNTERTLFNYL